jgi:hypothetical protein
MIIPRMITSNQTAREFSWGSLEKSHLATGKENRGPRQLPREKVFEQIQLFLGLHLYFKREAMVL